MADRSYLQLSNDNYYDNILPNIVLEAPHTPLMAPHVVWNNTKDPVSNALFNDYEGFTNQQNVYLGTPSQYSSSSSPYHEDLASPLSSIMPQLFFDPYDWNSFPTPSPINSRSSSHPPSSSSSGMPSTSRVRLPGTPPLESPSPYTTPTRKSSCPPFSSSGSSSRPVTSIATSPDGRRNRPSVQYPVGGSPSYHQPLLQTSPVHESSSLNMEAPVIPDPYSNFELVLPISAAAGKRRATDFEANPYSPASAGLDSAFHHADALRRAEDVEGRPFTDPYAGYSLEVESYLGKRRVDAGHGTFTSPYMGPGDVLHNVVALGKRKAAHSNSGSPSPSLYARDHTSSPPPIIPHDPSIRNRTEGTPETRASYGITTDDPPAFGKGGTRLPPSLSAQPARKRVRKTKPPPEILSATVATPELNKWIRSSLYGVLKGEKGLTCPICHRMMLDSMEKHLLTSHRHKDAKTARDTWDTSSWDVKLRMIHFTIVEIQEEQALALNREHHLEVDRFLSRYNDLSTWDGFPDEAKYKWLVPYSRQFAKHVAELWKCLRCGKECGQNFSLNRHLKKNCKSEGARSFRTWGVASTSEEPRRGSRRRDNIA